MNRQQLEHILRASGAITGADEFIVIGSHSILGHYPDAPPELLHSIEADLFSLQEPQAASLIDGTIGEMSPFHQTFGYYAHGVGPETATLPDGWRERLTPIHSPSTGGVTGLCLDPHDLAVAKLAAGRNKDMDYLAAMLQHQMLDLALLKERLRDTPGSDDLREAWTHRVAMLAERT
jgi:hypothetical protein